MSREHTIDRLAVLHIPQSQYAFPESEHRLNIRIRVKKHDLSQCILYYADRVCRSTPIEFYEFPMKVCAEDESFEYYEASLNTEFSRVCYYFKLIKGSEWTYYYADRFTKKLPDFHIDGKIVDGRSEYYQYPFILREEIPDVPAWFKTALVYNIFPDSFANGKRLVQEGAKEKRFDNGRICKSRLGGTLKGITENIDYIQKMGFTCLYLNPIFVGGEYHKYDVMDYYHIDPCLGTEDDFRKLVETLHKRGMRIVIDGVFNHCSWKFFAFEDVVEKGKASRFCKWFYDLSFPVIRPQNPQEIPNYTCFAYERKMPKLNTAEEEVQAYFADVGAYWVKEFHVDGWRLDVANEIDRNFWRKFRCAVRKANPEAVLIGEVWENAQTWLRGDMFDSVMNYEFRRICKEYIATEEADAEKTAYQFEQMRLRYPTNISNGQLNLLDSHDVPRFLSLCKGNVEKWKLACVLLMLMPGVPSLFYGDERGIMGVKEEEYRSPMLWRTEATLVEFVRKIAEVRNSYITKVSDYRPVWKYIREGMFAFERSNEEARLFVMVNTGIAKPIDKIKNAEILLSSGCKEGKIQKNGFLVYAVK